MATGSGRAAIFLRLRNGGRKKYPILLSHIELKRHGHDLADWSWARQVNPQTSGAQYQRIQYSNTTHSEYSSVPVDHRQTITASGAILIKRGAIV